MEVLEMTDINDVIKARARLMRKDIGIASMLLSLELVESTQHDTMATDGERIFYNPEWVATISPEEIEAVLSILVEEVIVIINYSILHAIM
jgi:predicted metal-dependent peptidase